MADETDNIAAKLESGTVNSDGALPQEVIDNIIDALSTDKTTLVQCCFAGRCLYPRSRRHLFRVFHVTGTPEPFTFQALGQLLRAKPSFIRDVEVLHLDGSRFPRSPDQRSFIAFSTPAKEATLHPNLFHTILCSFTMMHTLKLTSVRVDSDKPITFDDIQPVVHDDTPIPRPIVTTLAIHDTNMIVDSCDIPGCSSPMVIEPTTIEFTLDFALVLNMANYLSEPENTDRLQVLRFITPADGASNLVSQSFGQLLPTFHNLTELGCTVKMESWRSMAGYIHLGNAFAVCRISPKTLKRMSFHFIFKEGGAGKEGVYMFTDFIYLCGIHEWAQWDKYLQMLEDLERVTFSGDIIVVKNRTRKGLSQEQTELLAEMLPSLKERGIIRFV
ncbi:hypothetical protein C8Q75DRAFT_498110 [Abortiporus biennis]|nr:hypothetical protein C8Q75DRAFT_498110 [Abortiporus biennis]